MRLQINTTKEIVDEIDRRAGEIGISRNAMCAVLLHRAVMGDSADAAGGKSSVDNKPGEPPGSKEEDIGDG